jgi:hypothetical protein
MYTRQETSLIRQQFWTRFGQYMKPVLGASDQEINWINYKTGIRNLLFRMESVNDRTSISIVLEHPDTVTRKHYFERLLAMKSLFEQIAGAEWSWKEEVTLNGKTVSSIEKILEGPTINEEQYWPAIIPFLKSGIMALDQFWYEVKDQFD